MRIPSRNIPPRDEASSGRLGDFYVYSILLGVLALPGLYWWPLAFVMPAIFLLGTLYSSWSNGREAKRRSGESICSFARSFDCCAIDTWIIRGVYEEFSCSYQIRADDSFEKDLGIVDEDYEDSVVAIAQRIGRSLEDVESSPMNGKIKTVRDLVLFLQYQPKVA